MNSFKYLLNSILFLIFINKSYGQDSSKINFTLNFNLFNKHSELYYMSDTIPNYQETLNSYPQFKQNFQSLKVKISYNIYKKFDINFVNSLNLGGIKELQLSNKISNNVYDVTGISVRVLYGFTSISTGYNYSINKKFKIKPNAGLVLFYKVASSKDSNYYENFGDGEIMDFIIKKSKLGFTIGTDITYKITKKSSIVFNMDYNSAFDNEKMILGATRSTIYKNRYWYKYRKNYNALYYGIGFCTKLF